MAAAGAPVGPDAPGGSGQVDVRGDGGIAKTVRRAGVGQPFPQGTKVKVHYVGRLENGQQFDSSRDRGAPLTFTLGAREVILGWDLGVSTMRVGERAEFRISPDYAYGKSGAGGVIPPNATLVFDIELLGSITSSEVQKYTYIFGMLLIGLLLMYFSSGLSRDFFKTKPGG